MYKLVFSISLCYLLSACSSSALESPKEETVDINFDNQESIDNHTLSNYNLVNSTHIHLDIEVDFEEKKVKGSVTHTINNPSGVNEIIFDSRTLNIFSAQLDNGVETTFKTGESDDILGTPLHVAITPETKTVTVFYETTENTQALQWLTPIQTAGKQSPFLFTQGQAILTRSWIPIQDSPANRITYSAQIKVPSNLLAVMSATNPQKKNTEGIYNFEMKQSVPCYLMALAVGNLAFQAIDYRTGVYAEPEMLKDCVHELAEMGEMVTLAENLYGEYPWERYDVIVLPPSFPFGGMENPRLTFATPTIIAGDRSLTTLIAHELAHSWSGNLVTNSTWDDFWLNEGFTVYFERRIMEELKGKDYVDMLALLGYQDLMNDVAHLSEKDTYLKLRLRGRDPDEGMTDIAYEKGAFFLKMLEEASGREVFDAFLKNYFHTHRFSTLTTEAFVAYLEQNLLKPNNLSEVDIKEWVYGPGVPDNCPKIVSKNFQEVDKQLDEFYRTNSVKGMNIQAWSTHEWLHFLRGLRKETSVEQLAYLDKEFKLSKSGNAEILSIWFEKSINAGYPGIDPYLEQFLVRVGRRKFLMPLYTALTKTEEGKAKAVKIYEKARPNYHYVSSNSIDKLLGIEG
ncbi:MAG: M1 family metallopeptidase [Flavobacteriales bacterium]